MLLHEVGLFVAQVDNLDGYLFFGELVEALEGVALAREVQLVAETVRVVLNLLAQLVASLPLHPIITILHLTSSASYLTA